MVEKKTAEGRSVCTYVPENPKGLVFMAIDKPGTLSRTIDFIKDYTGKDFDMACICVQPTNAYVEYSPWQADNIYSGQAPFSGKAPEYLQTVNEKIIPEFLAEKGLEFPAEKCIATGYSLGALTALYTFAKEERFGNLAMCSASVWYPNLMEWLKETDMKHKDGKVYISIGDREQTDFLPAFSNLNRQVKEVKRILESKLSSPENVKFEWNYGEHGDNVPTRLGLALLDVESRM